MAWWEQIKDDFYLNFIQGDRWQFITTGLLNTLMITSMALIIGMFLGMIIAFVRVTYDNTGKLRFFNVIAKVYLTVIRGTPVVLQLLIMYFVIITNPRIHPIIVAAIAFGINSGAYMAEVFRSGIMSISHGQTEAGRSLGLSYRQTMLRIILPQAAKNSLPAMGNEFISLLKETAVAGYIAISDLTMGANIIRGTTYSPFMPLIGAGLIYLSIVMLITFLLGKLERRLRQSDRR